MNVTRLDWLEIISMKQGLICIVDFPQGRHDLPLYG